MARRRRVLAALRSEAELAKGVDGYNLEDSLPGDVLVAVGPGGELLQTKEAVHAFLAARAGPSPGSGPAHTAPTRGSTGALPRRRWHWWK
jgi:hypothetical protein